MCIPKISTQNLNVSFSPYEYLFWDTVVSQSIEVIDKKCIDQFGIHLVFARYRDHTIYIFIKDAEYDKINGKY